jgi:hypothetical protein
MGIKKKERASKVTEKMDQKTKGLDEKEGVKPQAG